MWIKICGITNIADALEISKLGVDALGFILSTDSPRKINTGKAKEIILSVKKNFLNLPNKKIPLFAGVFVNETTDKVIETAGDLSLDFLQFSGEENVEYMYKIKKHNKNFKLIKLIRIKAGNLTFNNSAEKMRDFKDVADYFLLDTFAENIYGGSGKTFDWKVLKGMISSCPIILAGGLDGENVAEAISTLKPFGVDASSKLEKYPGKKDIKKVKNFIKNALGRVD